jgi:hypothetical protein
MKKKKVFPGVFLIVIVSIFLMLLIFSSFYTYWNFASPEKTCASCHEIGLSVNSITESSHREMHCKECHGTATSNGFHSLKEKGIMIVSHLSGKIPHEIRLSEDQLLDVMNNCKSCHSSEFADWKSGGHSVSYAAIFLDSTHNKTVQLNSDCLRCHGMFFDGTTEDLVKPLDTKGPWILKDVQKAGQPAILCMSCHEIHSEGEPSVSPDYSNPSSVFYSRKISPSIISFYDRHEKVNVSADFLPELKLAIGEKTIKVNNDVTMRNCIQCHAPNSFHQAGTSDDRTPRGVHEGLSCNTCHDTHSNNAKNSCLNCHPAISNCKLDVTKMNTTYSDSKSPNNIHWVSCTDCHKDNKRIKKNR